MHIIYCVDAIKSQKRKNIHNLLLKIHANNKSGKFEIENRAYQ